MSHAVRELASVSSLQNLWVAIDPRGESPRDRHGRDLSDRETPLRVTLQSGAMVVDADGELDVLCARLKAAKQTSLTIIYNGKR